MNISIEMSRLTTIVNLRSEYEVIHFAQFVEIVYLWFL